eukprot:9371601-Pyramimonas_sp.AAC.1
MPRALSTQRSADCARRTRLAALDLLLGYPPGNAPFRKGNNRHVPHHRPLQKLFGRRDALP